MRFLFALLFAVMMLGFAPAYADEGSIKVDVAGTVPTHDNDPKFLCGQSIAIFDNGSDLATSSGSFTIATQPGGSVVVSGTYHVNVSSSALQQIAVVGVLPQGMYKVSLQDGKNFKHKVFKVGPCETPTPTPSATPTPVVTPIGTPTPQPTSTPTPRGTPTPQGTPTPRSTPQSTPTPVVVPSSGPPSVPPTEVINGVGTKLAETGYPLVVLIAAVLFILVGSIGVFLTRRKS